MRALVFPHHCGHGAERAAEIPHLPLPRATKAYAQGETMPRSAARPAKHVQSAGGRWRMAGGYIHRVQTHGMANLWSDPFGGMADRMYGEAALLDSTFRCGDVTLMVITHSITL